MLNKRIGLQSTRKYKIDSHKYWMIKEENSDVNDARSN